MAAFYLDYVGLTKVLRGLKNKLDGKVDGSGLSLADGVITINGASITPLTDVTWDPITHTLKQTKGGSTVAIVTGGAHNGIAFLDASGKVDSSQLPSYVDDIEEGILDKRELETAPNVYKLSEGIQATFSVDEFVYDDVASPYNLYKVTVGHFGNFDPTKAVIIPVFPVSGVKSKIYYDVVTEKSYRWTGSAYAEIIAHAGNTDDIPEGSTHLYFTDARALAAVATALSGKAAKNGSNLEDFSAKDFIAYNSITSKGAITVKNVSNNTVVEIGTDGKITVSKIIVSEIGDSEGGVNVATPLKVHSAPGSLVTPNTTQPNVAYVIEPVNQSNPGLLEDMTTSELYDAFAAAGITLGANKTEGEAILDGTAQS